MILKSLEGTLHRVSHLRAKVFELVVILLQAFAKGIFKTFLHILAGLNQLAQLGNLRISQTWHPLNDGIQFAFDLQPLQFFACDQSCLDLQVFNRAVVVLLQLLTLHEILGNRSAKLLRKINLSLKQFSGGISLKLLPLTCADLLLVKIKQGQPVLQLCLLQFVSIDPGLVQQHAQLQFLSCNLRNFFGFLRCLALFKANQAGVRASCWFRDGDAFEGASKPSSNFLSDAVDQLANPKAQGASR